MIGSVIGMSRTARSTISSSERDATVRYGISGSNAPTSVTKPEKNRSSQTIIRDQKRNLEITKSHTNGSTMR